MAAVLLLGVAATFQSCKNHKEAFYDDFYDDSYDDEVLRRAGAEKKTGRTLKNMLVGMADGLDGALCDIFLPALSFAGESVHGTYWLLQEQIDSLVPSYGFFTSGMAEETENKTDNKTDKKADIEADKETDREAERTDRITLRLPELETQLSEVSRPPETEARIPQDEDREDMSFLELLQAENEAALYMQEQGGGIFFTPHEQLAKVDIEPLYQYETLIKEFYTIDANTMAGSELLDVSKFLGQDMTVDKSGSGPQILIYHTHSQERFADSDPEDEADSIIGVGERLAQILTDTYGYNVMHHTGKYDVKVRDDAYSVSLPAIEKILKENPSIEVVIDLHRDEMAENVRLVTEIDGRPTARFMFFNGLSRTKKTGNIAYLYNENLGSNLAFSFQMQRKAMEYYPGLTRKIYLKGYRYNMHLREKYLLIELGAQNNTVEEAMNACDPLAHILNMVLSGE